MSDPLIVTVKVPAPFGAKFPTGTFETVCLYPCGAGVVTSVVVSDSGLSLTVVIELAPDVGASDAVHYFGPNAQRIG